MPDPKDPAATGLKDITVETLQRKIELLQQLNTLQDAHLKGMNAQIQSAATLAKTLSDRTAAEEKLSTIITSKSAQAEVASGKAQEDLQKEVNSLKKVQQELNNYEPGFFKKLAADAGPMVKKSTDLFNKFARDVKTGSKEINRHATESMKLGKVDWDMNTLLSAGEDALSILTAAGEETYKALARASAQTTAFGVLMPKIGFDVVAQKMGSMASEIDKGLRATVKSGIKHTTELDNIFMATLDPAGAERFGLIAEGASQKMLKNVGITAADTGKVLKEMKNEAMIFRNAYFIEEPEVAAQTANLVAGMQKIGVSTKTSIKAIDQFTMAMKKSPAQANKSLKKLINVAHSLDMNVGTAVKDFTELMPVISQFGDRAIDVFADLEAQSRATGMSVGGLNKMAMKLDTFKGAAKAAQGFNAVLGGTFLSVTDLVHADPAEKIEMIKEAMDRSGQSFETADRRVKSMIAGLLGTDVEKASRIFGSSEDFKTARSEMDKTATSNEDLTAKIKDQMTSAEHLQKTLSSTGAGFQKFVKRSRGAAIEGSKVMQDAFEGVVDKTKDTEKSVLAILGAMSALGKTAKTGKRAGGFIATVGGFAVLAKMIKNSLTAAGVDDEEQAKIIQELQANIPSAAAAPPPAAGGGGGGAGGGSPAAGGTASAIDRLAAVNQQVLEAIEKSYKDGGEFVSKLVVDGEELASHTYKWIREALDKEFKLIHK